jgi:hypothetical protein
MLQHLLACALLALAALPATAQDRPAVEQKRGAYESSTLPRRTWPASLQAGQGDVGVKLVEANLDVAHADPPAAQHVVAIVASGEQLAQPADQGALEALDLLSSASDDLAGVGVALDLLVEVVDQGRRGGASRSARAWTRRASSSDQPT